MPIFQPTDVSGCFGWYKASSIGWGAVTGYVTYWPDDSGSGNYLNLVKAGSGITRAPVYFTNIINGLPAVYFNGANRLDSQVSAVSRRNAGLPVAASSWTSFCVFSPKDVLNAQVIYAYNNDLQANSDKNSFVAGIGGAAGDFVANNPSGWFVGWGRDAGFGSWTSRTSGSGIRHPVNQWVLRTDRFDLTDRRFHFDFNGATYATGIASTSYNAVNYLTFGTDDEVAINSNRYYKGYIAEVILYNRILDTSDRENVESYLRNKYALDGTNGFPLFMLGAEDPTGVMYGNRTLYTTSTPSSASSTPLYTFSSASHTSGVNLYIGSSQTSSSGWRLYIGAASTFESGISLYVRGFSSDSSGMPLYVSASTTHASGRPLYTMCASTIESGRPLYTLNSESYSGLFPLYTVAGIESKYTNLYTCGVAAYSGGMSLYVGSSVTHASGRSLYIGSSTSTMNFLPLYSSASAMHSGSTPLYVPGGMQIGSTSLYSYGKGASSGSMPLYIGASTPINSSTTLFVRGLTGQSGTMNMFVKQNPPGTGSSSMTLYMSTPTTVGSSGKYDILSLYMYAFGVGASMPLILKNNETGSGSTYMPMYLKTTELVNPSYGNLTAYILNNTAMTGKKMKLYIRGEGSMDGAYVQDAHMNMFLKQRQGVSEVVNLYMNANVTGGLLAPLFTKGVYSYNSGMNLVISGRGGSGTVPLYVYAGGSANSGMSLYTYTTPSINNSKILYTYGF